MAHPRMVTSFADFLSTGCGLGLLPYAPGTWGSLPGLLLGYGGHLLCAWIGGQELSEVLLGPALAWAAALVAICAVIATWCISQTEKAWRCHDHKSIVIDEVVGQMAVAIFLPLRWELYLAAFVLFRLFDIWKPGPAGWVDKNLHGAFATLLDDLFAGLYACIVLGVYLYALT
jgi:phosphatidylglycerophosphatase A